MAYNEDEDFPEHGELTSSIPSFAGRRKRLPLGRSRQRLSFERWLRLALYLMGVPAFALTVLEFEQHHIDASIQWIALPTFVIVWMFLVSLLLEHILRPLQTLANVVAALREDDYSFRARGGRRNDAMGDLALEINALAGMLQVQRVGAMEAMALVERVMMSMQAPVLAFDPDGRLKLLNTAAEKAFNLRPESVQGRPLAKARASKADLDRLLNAEDNDLLSLSNSQQSARWVVKRSRFRLRGIPHTLFVLSDVSEALREEERLAWERLIRVLGHEINNSLTPIKSIAGSLRSMLDASSGMSEDDDDFARGLEVIEDRAESLNRFLQAYRELMGLPAPRLESVSLAAIVRKVAKLETRLNVSITGCADVSLHADPDQLAQALINLVRNAAEASLSPDAGDVRAARNGGLNGSVNGIVQRAPCVDINWETIDNEVLISILDNGPGLTNEDNLFVPFYTTKPGGTGIGLVLAQQIALGHSGSVQLINRADTHGCQACLRLPLVAASRTAG
ncbi:MAG TPA: ATP-binding protein [Acidobacteriaceae bacterium]|jgi:nitrogen fixation/metabolism regulation signal transduction histidine kinase|nr:ATP-binding protein [Acidobacteriaceae bacterium]